MQKRVRRLTISDRAAVLKVGPVVLRAELDGAPSVDEAYRKGWEQGLWRALENLYDRRTQMRHAAAQAVEHYREACIAAEPKHKATCGWGQAAMKRHEGKVATSLADLEALKQLDPAKWPCDCAKGWEYMAPEQPVTPEMTLGFEDVISMLETLLRHPVPLHIAVPDLGRAAARVG